MIHPESSFASAALRLIRANAARMAPVTPTGVTHTKQRQLCSNQTMSHRARYSPITLPIDTYSLPSKRINCIASIGA